MVIVPFLKRNHTEYYIESNAVICPMTDGVRRKVVETGGSFKVVIPKQLAELYGIGSGDTVEWTQGGPGELRLKKASQP